MTDPRKPRIFLIGYRGAGKTTLGRRLAQVLEWSFVDADEELESRYGTTIRDIFAAEGEPGPRSFQPMNVNFGLLPPVTVTRPEDHEGRWRGPEKAQAKKKAMSVRALADIADWA